MMINLRLVSQEHSQLPTKSFRLSPGLRANAALFLPWMSETVSMSTNCTSVRVLCCSRFILMLSFVKSSDDRSYHIRISHVGSGIFYEILISLASEL
ncbi:hypothetical protein MKW94_007090 [Papaver nudicaule]|uniref:Uncharacterized protein n=1 Tax=Papaver nudicaule TaxID=74823 RepID=A0AA42ARI4_PAPNU|nr:hypothetical protein [Papaver nudicaule]